MSIGSKAVSLLCAVALVLVAFAHRPAEAEPPAADPQIAAYLALGGSLDDLCLTGEAEHDHDRHADCPACTIAKAMALAPACVAPRPVAVWSGARAAWPSTLVLTGHGPRARPARGPPSIQLI